MRKLIVSNAMSLDGYYTGPDGDVMLLELDPAFDGYNVERLRSASTLLLGRTSFEGFKSFWPSVADDPNPQYTDDQREISRLDNSIDKVVVSDTLTDEDTAPWQESTRIVRRADAHAEVTALKQRDDDGDVLVFGSHTLWTDLLAVGLVDELHLMIGPVAIGSGTPMFDRSVASGHRPNCPIDSEVTLWLVATRAFEGSGNVLHTYEVGRI